MNTYGIVGQTAPELRVKEWIDGNGLPTHPITLDSLGSGYKILYCFQSWCPGCHHRGFPTLQKLVTELNDKVQFAVIQTVFEGQHENTREKIEETQRQYQLAIPFGHDAGDRTTQNRSFTMMDYRSGGTPWFIIIDPKNEVIFNEFHLNAEKTIEIFNRIP